MGVPEKGEPFYAVFYWRSSPPSYLVPELIRRWEVQGQLDAINNLIKGICYRLVPKTWEVVRVKNDEELEGTKGYR